MRKKVRKNPSVTTSSAPRELKVDLCGVIMFLPDLMKGILVDGRKARNSVTNGSVIPSHTPFVAIQTDTYKKVPALSSNLTFKYDVDGTGELITFDMFPIDGHRISFGGGVINRGASEVGGERLGSMKSLAPDLELCTGVRAGSSRQVVGTVDFTNATSVVGKAHAGHADSGLKFGNSNTAVPCADMVMATFDVGDQAPCVIAEKEYEKDGRKVIEKAVVELLGDGPWRVMVANMPLDQITNAEEPPNQHDIPLVHNELYYELYHLGRNTPLPVPRFDNHVHRTLNGRCGPTLQP
ncbi:MAG: hypothetical protein ACLGH0_15445 [Thermoanaerobaculia bacterium]